MSYCERHTVAVTTDGAGAATSYTGPITGRVRSVHYTKDSFDNGSTFLITSETTGQTIWSETGVNATATRAPRQATHSTLGAAALYAGGGSAVLEPIAVAQERIKIAITGGGATKAGSFTFVID